MYIVGRGRKVKYEDYEIYRRLRLVGIITGPYHRRYVLYDRPVAIGNYVIRHKSLSPVTAEQVANFVQYQYIRLETCGFLKSMMASPMIKKYLRISHLESAGYKGWFNRNHEGHRPHGPAIIYGLNDRTCIYLYHGVEINRPREPTYISPTAVRWSTHRWDSKKACTTNEIVTVDSDGTRSRRVARKSHSGSTIEWKTLDCYGCITARSV